MTVTVLDPQPRLRLCVYCGGRCYRGRTCEGHRDLPALDGRAHTPADQFSSLRRAA